MHHRTRFPIRGWGQGGRWVSARTSGSGGTLYDPRAALNATGLAQPGRCHGWVQSEPYPWRTPQTARIGSTKPIFRVGMAHPFWRYGSARVPNSHSRLGPGGPVGVRPYKRQRCRHWYDPRAALNATGLAQPGRCHGWVQSEPYPWRTPQTARIGSTKPIFRVGMAHPFWRYGSARVPNSHSRLGGRGAGGCPPVQAAAVPARYDPQRPSTPRDWVDQADATAGFNRNHTPGAPLKPLESAQPSRSSGRHGSSLLEVRISTRAIPIRGWGQGGRWVSARTSGSGAGTGMTPERPSTPRDWLNQADATAGFNRNHTPAHPSNRSNRLNQADLQGRHGSSLLEVRISTRAKFPFAVGGRGAGGRPPVQAAAVPALV